MKRWVGQAAKMSVAWKLQDRLAGGSGNVVAGDLGDSCLWQ